MLRIIQSLKAPLAIAFAVVAGFLSLTSHAMAQRQAVAHVNIPFAFQVGDKLMPAGDYLIKGVATNILEMDNRTNGTGVFAFVQPTEKAGPPARGSVSFHKYGDTYFLSSMVVPDSTLGYRSQPSKREIALNRETEQAKSTLVAINAERP